MEELIVERKSPFRNTTESNQWLTHSMYMQLVESQSPVLLSISAFHSQALPAPLESAFISEVPWAYAPHPLPPHTLLVVLISAVTPVGGFYPCPWFSHCASVCSWGWSPASAFLKNDLLGLGLPFGLVAYVHTWITNHWWRYPSAPGKSWVFSPGCLL